VRPVAFLHIPKTAGQTIHHELARAIGPDRVSPVRLHTQVPPGEPQMPPGYLFYSGHLDWTETDSLPPDRFVFTVLRDPRERIASFYFFLRAEAEAMGPEELAMRTGKRMVLTRSADDYFFGGNAKWQSFVRDHYENFYVAYLGSRRMRGRSDLADMDAQARVARALENARLIDRFYATSGLAALEADAARELGLVISVAGTRANAGPGAPGQVRWPDLMARIESDANRRRLEDFADLDAELLDRLGRERGLSLG
jgi:hypothetical protein